MADSLAVASRVREAIKKLGLRMSGDAIEAVNKSIEAAIKTAAARCKANGRQTIRPADF